MTEGRGVVSTFDEHRGLGTITTTDGAEIGFHCTEVADGSRTVAVGTAVVFQSLPRLGRWEAGAIRPVADEPA